MNVFQQSSSVVYCAALLLTALPCFPQKVSDSNRKKIVGFDPARYVSIYEDFGRTRQRTPLYTPPNDTRLLSADHESTIVFDLKKALSSEDGDVALNKIFIRAELKTAKGSTPVEVVGYSLIGESEKDKQSQIAFSFQTFDNIAGKLTNLYFTVRDILAATYGSDDCYAALVENSEKPEAVVQKCANANLAKFKDQLKVYGPEIEELARFFASPENRTVNAQIAVDIFEMDIESLQGIAAQISSEWANIKSGKLKDDELKASLELLLERTRLTAQDLSGLDRAIKKLIAGSAGVPLGGDQGVCPATDGARVKMGNLQDTAEFARKCLTESKRKQYIEKLRPYLVLGTIDLSKNSASAGDVLTVRIESKGPNQDAPGPKAEFRIQLTSYGWKTSIEPSLLFVKRIGVNEVDAARPSSSPIKSLQPVRFAPFPGVSLIASYNGGREKFRFLHYLAPGFGINATFMTFGAKRDFDPLANDGKGQFATVKGSNFEIGTGPVVTLFGNRISATYGWNLMASDRRSYFALGFGFLTLGKDLAGFIKKN